MTEAKILEAVGRLLAGQGFEGLGVNAVAREAGVDKVLIYRYFGGLDELLRAFAGSSRFWPTREEILGGALDDSGREDPAALSVRILHGYLRELRVRPDSQEILRWELIRRNELTDELARVREAQGLSWLDDLPADLGARSGLDLAAVAALLHAGLVYLVLRAKTADVYQGVDLRTESGWSRIEGAVDVLVRACFDHYGLVGRGKNE